MFVAVVDVGHVRVLVRERFMSMRMRVPLAGIDVALMRMLMVLVVPMAMRVQQERMGMRMPVTLGEMQPDANDHHQQCEPEFDSGPLTQYGERDRDADQR